MSKEEDVIKGWVEGKPLSELLKDWTCQQRNQLIKTVEDCLAQGIGNPVGVKRLLDDLEPFRTKPIEDVLKDLEAMTALKEMYPDLPPLDNAGLVAIFQLPKKRT